MQQTNYLFINYSLKFYFLVKIRVLQIEEDFFANFFARDFLAHFVVVVHPTTIFWSPITRSANA
jgi:hypothetical protein